jgi:hypothetical protein
MQNNITTAETSQKLFTQEEVNAMVSKRLKREKKQIERQVEEKLLEKEVSRIVQKENIPVSLLQFVISGKNEKQVRGDLEKLVSIWNEDVKIKISEAKL